MIEMKNMNLYNTTKVNKRKVGFYMKDATQINFTQIANSVIFR